MEVKLVSTWVTPFGLRAKMALELKGVKYEEIEEDLQNKSELLLQSNPVYKQVPVLIHNGKPVCESAIIVEYIDEVWPSSHKFLSEDPYERALARFWADYADKKLLQMLGSVLFKEGEEQAKAKEEMMEGIKRMERGHASLNPSHQHPFFGGEHPGFVDIIVAPLIAFFHASHTIADFHLSPHHHDFPRFLTWIKAVENHPVLAKFMPHTPKVVDYLIPIRKKKLQT